MKVFDISNRFTKRSKKIFGLQLYGVLVFCFLFFFMSKKGCFSFQTGGRFPIGFRFFE